jgi:tRNA pseudouridine32 synthase/23S rRNA pseudouridine746 synthase
MAAAICTECHTIAILYENDDFIAVDKPIGLASIPERDRGKISLLKLLSEARHQKFFVVHRLDKQVSGVILFAKTAETHRYLNELFEQRNIHKTYLAIVHGLIEEDSGTIDKPLRRFGSGRMGEDPGKGKPCLTQYTVEKRCSGYTRVNVYPQTGRKHQIRAHFFSIGHPIVGDTIYGDKSFQKKYPRLMLHALAIRFSSPEQEDLLIESPSPLVFP